jgi:putative nucleotidyltransferase with HDIG domain
MDLSSEQTVFKNKRILLIDDDSLFRHTLKSSLESIGYNVVDRGDGRQGQEAFSSEAFDAVISDIRMPENNGLSVLRYVQRTRPIPVILMTGFSDIAEMLTAHHHGATDFILKPFKKADIVRILEKCFSTPKTEEAISVTPAASETPKRSPTQVPLDLKPPVESNYRSVSIDSLVCGTETQYDVYVQMEPGTYIKIAAAGQSLSFELIRFFKAKGHQFLFLKAEDFKKYLSFTSSVFKAVQNYPALPKVKKLQLLKNIAEIALTEMFEGTLNAESFECARLFGELLLPLVQDVHDWETWLEVLRESPNPLFVHSLSCAFLSALIARGAGWNSPSVICKVAVGALVHDVGKKSFPKFLLEKPQNQFTEEEKKLFESHTTIGAQLLKTISGMPLEIIQIVSQHHECCNGNGYPERLYSKYIHPFARLVFVADQFCERLFDSKNERAPTSDELILEMSQECLETIDPTFFMTLIEVLKLKVPSTYEASFNRRKP